MPPHSAPTPTALHPLTFPLHGSRLIEASAGTGKTWTIAALYLRLVLGHGGANGFGGAALHGAPPPDTPVPTRPLLPGEILVMTFTRAATRELRDRIRARLVQAVACLRGDAPVPAHDNFLSELLADYPDPTAREQAAWRLDMAAQGMDEAAIFTIDAWCQRVLREHAFDSGSLMDEELEANPAHRLTEAVHDYWRQECYPLRGEALQQVLTVWPDVDQLLQDMNALHEAPLPPGHGNQTLADCLASYHTQHTQALQQLANGWAARADAFATWIDKQLNGKKTAWNTKLNGGHCHRWLDTLRNWAAHPHPHLAAALKTGAERLSPAWLQSIAPQGISPPPESHALQHLLQQLATLPSLASTLRLHAAARVRQRLQWLKTQAGTYGFADMLHRLDSALASNHGPILRQRLLAQYPVALIDEFQDTSPLQYRLFDRIYRTADNDPSTALLLIGDPKQSIYGFRGADIHSYLQARRATSGRHYMLGTNYRSTAALVRAVNHWFTRAEQRPGQGAFMFRSPAHTPDTPDTAPPPSPLPFIPVQAQGRAECLLHQGQPMPAMHIAWQPGPASNPTLPATTLHQHLASACAEAIAHWLNDPDTGFAPAAATTPTTAPIKRLRPSDIAILVRTGREAALIRRQLQRRGIASVFLSDRESVFSSAEAQDLLYWLRAVATPLDNHAARTALATRLMGLPLHTLQHLHNDDQALDGHTEQLRQLHLIWQRQGVLAMLRHTLHRLGLSGHWLDPNTPTHGQPAGERRLTNYLHLAELLQNASATLEGEQALIRWLATQIDNPTHDAEEHIVRLESDAGLVQVITIHKSKGLEYPIVCLPFAADFRPLQRRSTPYVRTRPDPTPAPTPGPLPTDAPVTPAIHLDYSAEQLTAADDERLREDLRLFYVALTRARHTIWLGLGPLRKGNNQDCINHRGPAGYLLAGPATLPPPQWLQQLHALATTCQAIVLQPLPPADPATPAPPPTMLRPHDTAAALRPVQPFTADFDRTWGIGSFSALIRDLTPTAAATSLHTPRPADDETLPPGEHNLTIATTPAPPATPDPTPAVWHHFLRGPLAGNFIHDQLEWLAGEHFSLPPASLPLRGHPLPEADPSAPPPAIVTRLRQRCRRAGWQQHTDAAITWLTAIVHHRLPVLDCALPALHRCLPEMEFWLPAERIPAAQVDALCRRHILPAANRPALPQRTLHGMLMGFADLVFHHAGRYWVMDYKTNHLGPDGSAYTTDALHAAMLHHRYDVQAALYLLALHRLLAARLGSSYDPQAQLGGALYYFVRGIDGPASGLCSITTGPDLLALLNGLQALLDG